MPPLAAISTSQRGGRGVGCLGFKEVLDVSETHLWQSVSYGSHISVLCVHVSLGHGVNFTTG